VILNIHMHHKDKVHAKNFIISFGCLQLDFFQFVRKYPLA
jgi:hypothetical protein